MSYASLVKAVSRAEREPQRATSLCERLLEARITDALAQETSGLVQSVADRPRHDRPNDLGQWQLSDRLVHVGWPEMATLERVVLILMYRVGLTKPAVAKRLKTSPEMVGRIRHAALVKSLAVQGDDPFVQQLQGAHP